MSDVKRYTWTSRGMCDDEQMTENRASEIWTGNEVKVSQEKSNWVKATDYETLRSELDIAEKALEFASGDVNAMKHGIEPSEMFWGPFETLTDRYKAQTRKELGV